MFQNTNNHILRLDTHKKNHKKLTVRWGGGRDTRSGIEDLKIRKKHPLCVCGSFSWSVKQFLVREWSQYWGCGEWIRCQPPIYNRTHTLMHTHTLTIQIQLRTEELCLKTQGITQTYRGALEAVGSGLPDQTRPRGGKLILVWPICVVDNLRIISWCVL